MTRTSFDTVAAVEANVRRDRVLSVPCPRCGAPVGETCGQPGGRRRQQQHGPRWDAWYKANPDREDT